MSSLWRGSDHLVHVRGKGLLLSFTEDYKRYRFSDIQSFVVARKSRWGRAFMLALGAVFAALPVLMIFGFIDGESFGLGTAISVSVFILLSLCFLGLLVHHLVLGPMCVCEVQTSLSRERLLPLNRYHKTMEVIGSLEEDIRGAQSGIRTNLVSGSELSGSSRGEGVPVAVYPALGLAVGFSLATLAAVHLESFGLVGLSLALMALLSTALMVAMVSSVKRPTPDSIRGVLWGILGMLFVFLGTAIVYFLVTVAAKPGYTLDPTGPLEVFAALVVEGGVVFYPLFLVLSIGLLGAGATGLVMAAKWQAKMKGAVAGVETAGEDTDG